MEGFLPFGIKTHQLFLLRCLSRWPGLSRRKVGMPTLRRQTDCLVLCTF